MKKIIGLSLLSSGILLTACGDSQTQAKETAKDTSAVMSSEALASKIYDVSLVVNKKDPTCGMPVTAGISDTAHYNNLVLGFCSTECKNEFLKNPKASIAAAELKK